MKKDGEYKQMDNIFYKKAYKFYVAVGVVFHNTI